MAPPRIAWSAFRSVPAFLLAASAAWLALGAGAPSRARADGFIYVPEARRIVRPHPRHLRHFPLRVTRHRVTIEIDDTLARTRVDETFHNPNARRLEGTYLFPLPAGAGISEFTMKIGGKEVAGEVLEKDKAREIYQDIVRKLRDPGLLEYVERGLFRARVFPIPAKGDVEVAVEYEQTLHRQHGVTEYRYPLDTGKYSSGPYENVVIEALIRSSQPLRSVFSPTHDVSVDRDGDGSAHVGFEAKKVSADEDFVLQWNVSEDDLAPLLTTHRGHEEQGFFFLSLAPRPDLPEEAPPKDVVFVIDTSGSMKGRKMRQVREALRYCVNGLNEGDRFNIVDFSTEARRFEDRVAEATSGVRKRALAYIDGLEARGGTNLEEALRFAFEDDEGEERLRMVVLLTDGEPTMGVTRPEEILESVRDRNDAGRRIFAFGVGEDLNAKLLDSIVQENRGASQYIRGDQDLEVPLSNFYDKIDSPVLTDIALEMRGGTIERVYPKPLPDLFRGEQLDIFGRYDEDGRKTVVVTGRWLGTQRVFEYSLEFEGEKHPEIPRLWALRAVGHLLEQIRLHGESDELVEEIVRLSKLHGVLTPYTSYLILEEDRLASRTARPGEPGVERLRGAAGAALRESLRVPAGEAATPEAADAARDLRRRVESEAETFREEDGAGAVELSRRLSELKSGGRGAGRAVEEAGVRAGARRVVRTLDRTFFRQGDRWIEAALVVAGALDEEDGRRVEYLSEEYFALLGEHPGIGPLLGVGPKVTFRWDGRVIAVD